MTTPKIAIQGIFVVDVAYWASRLPRMGETLIGSDFKLGPGGKGSNQAIAAARAGADVTFISKIGEDDFGALGRRLYADEGVDDRFVFTAPDLPTGSAFIFVQERTGANAIIVTPGASGALEEAEIDRAAAGIAACTVFVTQLEMPVPIALHGLRTARRLGLKTVLNPAPATELPEEIYPLIDYFTPNEPEASMLCGLPVASVAQAEAAADAFIARGVTCPIITLGAAGCLIKQAGATDHIEAVSAGPVVDTTGAGDAFNGGFATAIAEGLDPVAAARFGNAVAGLSVTRVGTAPSMPHRKEVETLLSGLPSRLNVGA